MPLSVTTIGLIRADLLLWGLSLVLLAWFLLDMRRRKALRLASLGGNAELISGFVKSLLPLFLSGLLFCALLRPYTGFEEFRITTQGANVLAVVDVSLSMLTEDVSPSRLEAVRRKLEDLISLLQERKAGERLGLVVFAGGSYVLCPFTADYSILRMYVRAISTDLISSEGSAINAALETAAQSVEDSQVSAVSVLLLSDGEDNFFDTGRAASVLAKLRGRLDVIGFGTDEGRPINAADGKFITDLKGNIVISRLNEKVLSSLAQMGKGTFRRATLDDADLRKILPAASPRDASEKQDSQTLRVYRETGPILLMLLLAAICWCYFRGSSRLILPILLFIALSVPLQAEEPPSLYESYRAYQEGDFNRALSGFEAHSHRNPADTEILQALGSTLYKLGRHDEAARAFAKAAEQSRMSSGRRRFENLFNQGNSDFMAGRFEDAVSRYQDALRLKDGDPQALHNLELAKKRLEQKKQQEQENENKDQKKEQENKQDQKPLEDKPGDEKKQDQKQEQAGEKEQDHLSQGDQNGGEQEQAQPQGTEKPGEAKPDAAESRKSPSPENDPEQNAVAPRGESQKEERELKASEARQWLESLDDSPLLLNQKKQSRERVNPQSW